MTRVPAIGMAISGAGFRACAFGLGCLRALHDRDLLRDIQVVSGISGGALLAALWAYGPAAFEDFDASTVEILSTGIERDLMRRVLSPGHLARSSGSTAKSLLPGLRQRVLRGTTRTDALRRILESRFFGDVTLERPTHPGLVTVLSATDLRTTNAVRFSSAGSSCSPYGRIEEPVSVAEAVSASAAYPLLLPAVERSYTFVGRDGSRNQRRVSLTDGGVYDNLGLSVLLPRRSRAHTDHVYDLDFIIAIDAGRGHPGDSHARFLPFRLKRSFDITYRKTQDGGRAMLNAAAASGQLAGFVHSYLGMSDRNMPVPVADLVPVSRVASYPTRFRPIAPDDLAALTTRGEQLTRALIEFYLPALAR